MSRWSRVAAICALGAALSACQVTVTYTTTLAEDGSGVFSVGMALDAEAVQQARPEVVEAFFDSLEERGWAISRTEPDGGLALEASRTFEDPDAFGDILDEVRSTRDGAQSGEFGQIGLRMSIDQQRGAVQTESSFEGDIDFGSLDELPEEALAELQRAVVYEIILDLPGDERVSDGEAILDERGRVVWQPLLGEAMTFAATSTVRDPALFIGILLGGIGLGLAALALMVRQRRRARHTIRSGGLTIEEQRGAGFDVEAAAARIRTEAPPSPSLDEFEFEPEPPPRDPFD